VSRAVAQIPPVSRLDPCGTPAAARDASAIRRTGLLVVASFVTRFAQSTRSVAGATHLTLDAAIAEALDQNLTLIATGAGVTRADANLITAGIRPNPVLSLGGRKRSRRVAVAEEERAMAEAEVLDAVRRLKLEVQQAFIDVQLAQENLAGSRERCASAGDRPGIVVLADAE